VFAAGENYKKKFSKRTEKKFFVSLRRLLLLFSSNCLRTQGFWVSYLGACVHFRHNDSGRGQANHNTSGKIATRVYGVQKLADHGA
jgi:hypothetical protein